MNVGFLIGVGLLVINPWNSENKNKYWWKNLSYEVIHKSFDVGELAILCCFKEFRSCPWHCKSFLADINNHSTFLSQTYHSSSSVFTHPGIFSMFIIHSVWSCPWECELCKLHFMIVSPWCYEFAYCHFLLFFLINKDVVNINFFIHTVL